MKATNFQVVSLNPHLQSNSHRLGIRGRIESDNRTLWLDGDKYNIVERTCDQILSQIENVNRPYIRDDYRTDANSSYSA